MADYCVSCHEKMNKGIDWMIHDHPWEYVLDYGICEGCGQYRDDLVVGMKPSLFLMLWQKRKYKHKENK